MDNDFDFGTDFDTISFEQQEEICENLKKKIREDHIKMFGSYTLEILTLPDGTRKILN